MRAALPRRRAAAREDGAAVAEWVMIMGLLLFLVLGVIQVCLVLHVHNILVADAQEGARYGANANVSAEQGAERAKERIDESVGPATAAAITCTGTVVDEPSGASTVRVVQVECRGKLPLPLAPVLGSIGMDVQGHAVEESQ